MSSLSNKEFSIKHKIFIGVSIFIILNIILNTFIINISINDIYLSLEKAKLKKQYNLIKNNYYDVDNLLNIIYNANENGIKVKVFDTNYNISYSIFNDRLDKQFSTIDINLINSLGKSNSKIITLKNVNNGYNIYLVGKIDRGYVIISSSVDSLKDDAKTANVIIFISSIISLIIIMIIMNWVSKKIANKINEVKDVTNEIANLNFSKKINVNSSDELGDLLNNVNVMSDKLEKSISELEITNKKLKQELINKEKQEQARKKLIANISHEFKTPLTIISGYSQLLMDSVNKKDDKESLELIISESQRLSDLVYEFLDLSKLESGNVKLDLSLFNLKEVIEDELNKMDVRIKDRKISIETKLKNIEVKADKKMITRVVENLLTNAIKFTKGSKKIIIELKDDTDYVHLEVFNTGNKIQESEIETIFNSYYKDKSSRNKEGTGLGLTIVKAIMDLHNGKCKVENVKDGVRFIVSLKL